MHILIADDNLPSRILLSKLLEKLGYEVFIASDGKEAWEILKTNKISFVITDWIMPVMDGLELCKKIRNTDFGHYVYIVILTSKEEKSEMIEGLESGADDFIVKPFDKGVISKKMSRIGLCEEDENKADNKNSVRKS